MGRGWCPGKMTPAFGTGWPQGVSVEGLTCSLTESQQMGDLGGQQRGEAGEGGSRGRVLLCADTARAGGLQINPQGPRQPDPGGVTPQQGAGWAD